MDRGVTCEEHGEMGSDEMSVYGNTPDVACMQGKHVHTPFCPKGYGKLASEVITISVPANQSE